ncbi:hypothetical protein AVEN_78066-1 [Araneus ventricosus]|uniref:Ig-like domain-containing protein n=1 Tax=Araneus ventricosus TaxID=182803 RepID=A0A4Y2MVY6_ARAVE|nr:hypothetical protein AVEN_78066-1 [Araneus ventricosus]
MEKKIREKGIPRFPKVVQHGSGHRSGVITNGAGERYKENEIYGCDPSPAVKWWRDAELLDDSYYITPQGFARNELLLPSLKRADLMTQLTCQVSNSNLTAPVTSSVIIDMNRNDLLYPLELKWQKFAEVIPPEKIPGVDESTQQEDFGEENSILDPTVSHIQRQQVTKVRHICSNSKNFNGKKGRWIFSSILRRTQGK